ncbi:MAG: peptidase M61 [Variovorax sp.]
MSTRRVGRPRVHYRVECADRNAHLFAVTLTIDAPTQRQRVALPVWIPGSYLVREFSKNLQGLHAAQARLPVELVQQDKHSWVALCQPGKRLQLRYEICAYDRSVRSAWLDAERGFFNATSLCLRVDGQTDKPHALDMVEPVQGQGEAPWSCATTLTAAQVDARGFGRYVAENYDELADSPVELGAFWYADFEASGVPHRFVVAGAAASFNDQRLIDDTRAICNAEMRFWHGDAAERGSEGHAPPHDRYLFLLNAVDEGYGGLEHRHSTALICNRRDLPRRGAGKQPEGYTTLLGLISHEYFHTWNVKRMRPKEFERYDYERENYTRLLWLFEGFTSYYDDLLLRRAGCIDDNTYLRLLGKTINGVLQGPGRLVQSVAASSFDAWVKYYRQDEQTPNATVNYYTKGALVAMCFDLTLRSEGHGTLDDVMRHLWATSRGGPISEDDFADAIAAVGRRSYAAEIAAWVDGTSELPLESLLLAHGVAALDEPAQPAQALGLRVGEGSRGVQIKMVLRGGAAERAGFAAGDEWIGVESATQAAKRRRHAPFAWRLNKLEELALYTGGHSRCIALVARDRRLLRLPLELPDDVKSLRLVINDQVALSRWLAG